MNYYTPLYAAFNFPLLHVVMAVVLLCFLAALFRSRHRKTWEEKVDLPQPGWFGRVSGTYIKAIRISPTHSLYSTHLFKRGAVQGRAVVFGGKIYKITSNATHFNYPELMDGYTGERDDVSIFEHEEVPGEFVTIAEKVPDDTVIAYLNDKTMRCFVADGTESINISAGVTYGDSGSPVTTEEGKLLALITSNTGTGANLTNAREKILKHLE